MFKCLKHTKSQTLTFLMRFKVVSFQEFTKKIHKSVQGLWKCSELFNSPQNKPGRF